MSEGEGAGGGGGRTRDIARVSGVLSGLMALLIEDEIEANSRCYPALSFSTHVAGFIALRHTRRPISVGINVKRYNTPRLRNSAGLTRASSTRPAELKVICRSPSWVNRYPDRRQSTLLPVK